LEDLVEFAGNIVAFEVGEVLRQPRRTKAAAVVAHDPGHDDDATDASIDPESGIFVAAADRPWRSA
jgi:hypothetical protein